jgi:hypothetical protein
MHFAVTPSSAARVDGRDAPVRVLFLGSRLARRDVLGLCRQLLQQAGSATQLDHIVAAGLGKAWNADGTVTAINLGWDLVMMVESAARIGTAAEGYASMARIIGVAARAAGARVALLEPAPGPCVGDWRRIARAVEDAARAAHADIVPVGSAWRTALAVRPGLPLITPSGRATTLGAYLVASTIAHFISGKSLQALEIPGVPGGCTALAHRAAMDAIALDTVSPAS